MHWTNPYENTWQGGDFRITNLPRDGRDHFIIHRLTGDTHSKRGKVWEPVLAGNSRALYRMTLNAAKAYCQYWGSK